MEEENIRCTEAKITFSVGLNQHGEPVGPIKVVNDSTWDVVVVQLPQPPKIKIKENILIPAGYIKLIEPIQHEVIDLSNIAIKIVR